MVLGAFSHLSGVFGRVATAVVLMSVLLLSAPIASAQTFSFNSFDVQGNVRTNDASILEVAGITPGQSVSAGQVNDALQRLQNSGLFERVDVAPGEVVHLRGQPQSAASLFWSYASVRGSR